MKTENSSSIPPSHLNLSTPVPVPQSRGVLCLGMVVLGLFMGNLARAGYAVQVSGYAGAYSQWGVWDLHGTPRWESNQQSDTLPNWGPGGSIGAASGGGFSGDASGNGGALILETVSSAANASIDIPTLTISGHAIATMALSDTPASGSAGADSQATMTIWSRHLVRFIMFIIMFINTILYF